mmetsp:Transcript_2977/g.8612  ORF Transcript_2977/g.8612 Transcript_2977/m.8612 type:complete len:95 (-) Transcript_2977:24-308(-)
MRYLLIVFLVAVAAAPPARTNEYTTAFAHAAEVDESTNSSYEAMNESTSELNLHSLPKNIEGAVMDVKLSAELQTGVEVRRERRLRRHEQVEAS